MFRAPNESGSFSSPLHRANNVKANCYIDEVPEGRFPFSIMANYNNGINLAYAPNIRTPISNWFTRGGRNIFKLERTSIVNFYNNSENTLNVMTLAT